MDTLLPVNCLDCGLAGTLLCEKCLGKIALNRTFFCGNCGRRLAENKKICHRQTPYILAAAASYDNPIVRKLVWLLKYKRCRPASKPLALIIHKYLVGARLDLSGYKIIPVPLHRERLAEREFNQAELIARSLMEITADKNSRGPALPAALINGAVRKIRNNRPQAKIRDRQERENNTRDCFRVADPNLVKNQQIAILDDVSTSGATLEELALTLKKAGAKKIIGLVVAKG